MPAVVLRKFLGERHGVVSRGKDGSRFVRIPAAVDNMEIKPASLSKNLSSGFVEHMNSRRVTLDMALGCMLQRNGHESYKRIDSVIEGAPDLLGEYRA